MVGEAGSFMNHSHCTSPKGYRPRPLGSSFISSRRFRTDGMKGAGHDTAVRVLRAHRRFYYFTKHPKCGIFEFEKSLLVDTITNATPERAEVRLSGHLTTIMSHGA